MLRRKRGTAACSLTSSCRIKAEALARAFNRRIWPCTWVDRRTRTPSMTDEYDDEEYFETEDGRGRDNSVAKEDDRTNLYELLIQQHQQSVDDAMEVFYDVSEHVVAQLSDCDNIGAGIVRKQPSSIKFCKSDEHCSEKFRDLNVISDSLSVNGENVSTDFDNAGCGKVMKQPNSKRCCESDENVSIEHLNTNGVLSGSNVDINFSQQNERSDPNNLTGFIHQEHFNVVESKFEKEETLNLCHSKMCLEKCSNDCSQDQSVRLTNSTGSINCLNDDSGNDFTLEPEVKFVQSNSSLNHISEDKSNNILLENKEITKFENLDCLSKCNGILETFVQQNNFHSPSYKEQKMCTSIDCCASDHFTEPKHKYLFNFNDASEFIDNHSVNECGVDTDLVPEIQSQFPSNCCPLSRDNCNTLDEFSSTNTDKNSSSLTFQFEMPIIHSQESVKSIVNLDVNTSSFVENEIDEPKNVVNTLQYSVLQNEKTELNLVSQEDYINSAKLVLAQEESLDFQNDQELNETKGICSFCEDNQTTEDQSLLVLHENDEKGLTSGFQNKILDLNSTNAENQAEEHGPHLLIQKCLSKKIVPGFNNGTENAVNIKISSDNSVETVSGNTSLAQITIQDDDNLLQIFNETRPMISRSTSLKTGKTPPGTPSRKKIVRFADVLGLDLEDVRHIISDDLPNIPSSAYSDLVLDEPPFTPECNKVELNHRQPSSWESLQGAAGPNTLFPEFEIPGQQPDFDDRVRIRGICLESMIISDCNIQCTCRVMNWGFNKKVTARYTTNGWCSSSDINASYVPDSTHDGMDSFAFNVFLTRQRNDLEFALCYKVNDKEYWDNNSGNNYKLAYHDNNKAISTSVPSSPTWNHQFW